MLIKRHNLYKHIRNRHEGDQLRGSIATWICCRLMQKRTMKQMLLANQVSISIT